MKQGVWSKLVAALAPLAVLGVVVLVGCVDEEATPARTTPPFPHKHHVIDEEIECTVCHKDAKKADVAGMPTIKSCAKCHTGTDEKKKPNELQIKGFVRDGQTVWSNVTATFVMKESEKKEPEKKEPEKKEPEKKETEKKEPEKKETEKKEPEKKEPESWAHERKGPSKNVSDKISFSHKTHADAKVQCATCHKGIEKSLVVSKQLRLTMPDCVSCHAKVSVGAGVTDNCRICHTAVSKEWRPPSHDKNWKEIHGKYSGFVRKGSNQSCSLCHTDKSCTLCHRIEQPKSHTNYWRLRGHGVTADMDRSSCKACHTEDFCVRCHQSVTPQNHRGNWDNQHCLGCHFPLKDNSCVVCHKNDIRHRIAPPLPVTQVHKQAQPTDCRNCHGGLKRPHLDNGDDCLNCHRR